MKLVIGGAFQGKKEYALSTFQVKQEQMTDGMTCGRDEIFSAVLLVHFHEYIRRFMQEEDFLKELPEQLQQKNPELILVTNELGCGVVPIDAFDRAYREQTGRICTRIARKAGEVHRVICGIGTVIKND